MKIKIASLLLALCLTIPMMVLPVSAMELNSSVTGSKSILFVGQELDIVVGLANYAVGTADVRGLQIDVGVDSNVWEVVSCSSEIVDSAEKNVVSYHEADGCVRLLYLNLSGTLDRSVTQVLHMRLRLKSDISNSGIATFPVSWKIVTTTENIVLNDELKVEYHGVMLGDVTGDRKVNNRDLGILQQYLNDITETIIVSAADVNCDGNLNNRDLGILQRYLNDWDVELG